MKAIINLLARVWSRCEERNPGQWVRVIYRDNRPLITRYYLLSTRWIEDSEFFSKRPSLQKMLSWASFRLVLHQMHESDADGLHDHPWPWASLILSGGYFENTPDGTFFRAPWHLRFRPATALHRLVMAPQVTDEVWTLFFMARRQREWGFITDEKWVHWKSHSDKSVMR